LCRSLPWPNAYAKETYKSTQKNYISAKKLGLSAKELYISAKKKHLASATDSTSASVGVALCLGPVFGLIGFDAFFFGDGC